MSVGPELPIKNCVSTKPKVSVDTAAILCTNRDSVSFGLNELVQKEDAHHMNSSPNAFLWINTFWRLTSLTYGEIHYPWAAFTHDLDEGV